MSNLLLSWVNDEVQLTKKISDFEKDFANGYYFGELLAKFNQQLNFDKFSNENLRDVKIKNFQLLEPTFKSLHVDFNTNIVDSIIKGKKHAAVQLLYQLKMALEKVNNPADINVFNSIGKLNTIAPLKRLEPRREQYDQMDSVFFEKTLNKMNKAQKQVDLDKHMEKFSYIQKELEEKAKRLIEEEQINERNIKEEMRKISLNKLQRNMTFMDNWHKKGLENWSKNMDIKHSREQRDKEFEMRIQKIKLEKLTKIAEIEHEEVFDGIANFEKNLQRYGIETELEADAEKKRTEKGSFTIIMANTQVGTKLKEKKTQTEFARKERDKRRRKMIVDQMKSQREVEIKKREEILIEKLDQQSKQEMEIDYEIWRAYQSKNVISENRRIRNERYQKKLDDQTFIAQVKEEELLKILTDENQINLEQKKIRQKELYILHASEKRNQTYKFCENLTNVIFDIADLCYEHQQDTDKEDIDNRFWRECTKLFIDGFPLLPKKTFRDIDSTSILTRPYTQDIQLSTNQLATMELSDYLNGLGQWKPIHKFEQQINDEDDKYIPNNPIHNLILGGIVFELIDLKYPEKFKINTPELPTYMPLKIAMLGYDFSGRKTIAELLKSKYDLHILYIDNLIKELVDMAMNKTNKILKNEETNRESSGRNDINKLSLQVSELLLNGKIIPDELLIEVIVFKIKSIFNMKTDEDLSKYHENLKNKYLLHNDIQDIQENMEKSSLNSLGFIIIGFPNTYNQAKALEKALSGYIPNDERPIMQADIEKESALQILKIVENTILERKLIEGGLDCAISLEIEKDECLKRALGRRVDLQTFKSFHLEHNPPPNNETPLIERLTRINDALNCEEILVDKHAEYEKNQKELENWLSLFGIEDEKMSIFQKIDGFGEIHEVFHRVDQQINKVLACKQKKYETMLENADQKQKKEIEDEARRKQEEEEDAIMTIRESTIYQNILQEIIKRAERANLTPELIDILFKLWNIILQNYIVHIKEIFINMREQREFIIVRMCEMQRRFLEQIQRQDEKLLYVLKYQETYNKFVDENPDLIEEIRTKEELHQRVEDLHDTLWEIIENKKDDLNEERKQIMASGFIENEMELLFINVQRFIQAELDRYFGSIQLISDYYAIVDGKELVDPPENIFFELPNYTTMPTPLSIESEDFSSYPRLERVFIDALKLINGEELDDHNAAKGKSQPKQAQKVAAPDTKKGSKKSGKDDITEEKKELSALEKEMKKAIACERAIMRYRMTVLKNVSISRMKEMRLMAKTVYNKLDDWIYYSIKAENDAVYDITKLMRKAIEDQKKLQEELQLNYVDVIVNHKFLNFLTPPPIILPPKEISIPSRFTISQLCILFEELKSLVNDNNIIDSKLLLQYLIRRAGNSLFKDDFPLEWKEKDIKEYQKIINNLDPKSLGYIDFKKLCTYLCLLNSQIPKEFELEDYKNSIYEASGSNFVKYNDFVSYISQQNLKILQIPAWFDVYETSNIIEHNAEFFDRVSLIKGLLFHIHQELGNDNIDINSLIESLKPIENQRKNDIPPKSPTKSPNKTPNKSPNISHIESPEKSLIKNISRKSSIRMSFTKNILIRYADLLFD